MPILNTACVVQIKLWYIYNLYLIINTNNNINLDLSSGYDAWIRFPIIPTVAGTKIKTDVIQKIKQNSTPKKVGSYILKYFFKISYQIYS